MVCLLPASHACIFKVAVQLNTSKLVNVTPINVYQTVVIQLVTKFRLSFHFSDEYCTESSSLYVL